MQSVIIPNYNGGQFFKKCLESLKTQNCSFEVIIVDNASQDGSAEYVKERYPEFTLIQNKTNLGFAAAVNQGISAAKTEYVFLINNDVVLGENCVPTMVKCIEKGDNIFAVSSKIVQYHDPTKMDDAGDEYTLLGWTKRVGYGKSSDGYINQREIFSACAGAALYRKSVFDQIGYFDENFFAYLEDVDISYRARIHGYKCVYCPEALVYHVGSASSGSRYNDFKIRLSARNNVYLPYKNMPWPQLAFNSVFLILGFFIKYFFFYRMGEGSTYIAGLRDGFNSLNKIEKVRYRKENLYNYLWIEWFLFKNTMKFIFF